jgi:lipopolysaccharide heptosyltransferase II
MPKRQRWTPVSGTASRIADPLERIAVGGVDVFGRAAAALVGRPSAAEVPAGEVREILVLRLDRIGDLLMSLPALAELRSAFPRARIRLAVGAWSAPVARRAPVDDVLVWSAPWVGRREEGADSIPALFRRARALRREALDLALDLQGDVRASLLLALTGARVRVGYANTGGDWLLTRVVPLDETVSWVEQNRRAVAVAAGRAGDLPGALPRVPLVTAEERAAARQTLAEAGLAGGPLVGLHPSGGRAVKQWPVDRWLEVARRLQAEAGAHIVLTGSGADRELTRRIAADLSGPVADFAGRLDLLRTLAVIASLDLYLSPDTGPMHMAAAVGTPSVSVFGPSDPVRYFSGGAGTPGTRHVVVRADLWCAPCNLIRRPPEECLGAEGPECLRAVSVERVHAAALRVLRETSREREAPARP